MTTSVSATPHWHSLRVNALATLAARLLVPALSLVLVIAIARLGGAASLGQYTLLVTAFVLCENVKSLGLPALTVREIAARGPQALSYYTGLIRVGLWGACLTAPAMVFGLWTMEGHSTSFALAAAVLSLGLFPSAYALAGDALFLGIGRATYSLWVAFGENVLRLAGSLVVVFFLHGGLTALAAVYAGTRCMAAIAQRVLIRRVLGPSLPTPPRDVLNEMLRRVPTFFVVFIAPLALLRLDIVVLGVLRGDAEVGIYSAAMRLLTVCLIVPDGIMAASFAMLSKLSGSESSLTFYLLVEKTIYWLGAALIPLSATLALLSSFGTGLLFGPKFAAAAAPARTLAWALVPFAVNRALGDAMVARGLQRTVAGIILTSFVVSSALYLLFIQMWDVEGAAWAFYSSVLLFCLMSIGCAWKQAGLRLLRAVSFSLLPAMTCCLFFSLSHSKVLWMISGIAASGVAALPVLSLLRPKKANPVRPIPQLTAEAR